MGYPSLPGVSLTNIFADLLNNDENIIKGLREAGHFMNFQGTR